MRYNEKNSEQIGGKNIISHLCDDNSIIEVSAQIMTDVSGTIQANYDLIVCGNIDVTSLNVMGNLICFGGCKADYMNVQGHCNVFGVLDVRDGIFSDNINTCEFVVDKAEVKGKIICDSIDCQGELSVQNKVIVSEGITGDGKINCELILCGEYAFVDDNNANIFVVGEIEDKLSKLRLQDSHMETTEEVEIEELDWEECETYIESLARKNSFYRKDYEDYKLILSWSECVKIKTLNQFIELMDLLNNCGEITRKSDLYKVVVEELWKKSKECIFELQLTSINQDEFVKYLNIISKNKNTISRDIYEYLQKEIFNRIGLKYSTVVMMLGE